MRPDDIVANLLDSQEEGASARRWTKSAAERTASVPSRPKPMAASPPAPPANESRNPFKRKPNKLPVEGSKTLTAVEQETIVNPVAPPAVPKVESVTPEPEPIPEPEIVQPSAAKIEITPPPVTSPRDLAEQEIVDLILRAQRVSKSTGAPLEVCLEELRKHLAPKPAVADVATKSKVRRLEFQTSKDGLLTGAKVIEE